MIVCLFIVLAGYALIFGAGNFAERALKTAAGLAIILSVAPALLAAFGGWLRGASVGGDVRLVAWLGDVIVIAALIGVGIFAWRSRDAWARRRAARATAAPRERVLPPPPHDDASDFGDRS